MAVTNNPRILAPFQEKKEKSIGAPLGNILTKGAGILGKFAQRNPALLLGLGSSLLSGKGFGPSLADAGKAQATANKYITDQEAAKQAAYLARLKYLNEVRKTDIDEYRADTDRWKAQNPSPGKPNTIKQSDLNVAFNYLLKMKKINNLQFPGDFKDQDKRLLAQVLALNVRELMDIEGLSQKDALPKAFDIVQNKGIVGKGDGFSTLWGFGRSAEINPKGGGNSSSAGGNSFSEGHLITSPDTGDLSWVPN
tara:strand:+ start:50 stop:805 length:756 start_codon:yes stop_codon:yes gene_type:complete